MAEEENGLGSSENTKGQDGALREYTSEEVAQHNSKDSLWLVIDNKVYDVTSFQESHPGTATPLLNNAGQDATEGFLSIGHSPSAVEQREEFLIGKLAQGKPVVSSTEGKEPLTTSSGGREPQTGSTEAREPQNNARGCCGVTTLSVIGISVVAVAVAAVIVYRIRSR